MSGNRTELLLALGLAALTLFTFWPACNNGFVNFDDEEYVVTNPHVLGGLTGDSVVWAFRTFRSSNWHPLTWLSLQLDASLWKNRNGGLDPRGFHLTNVLLHTANGVLLFLVLCRLTGRHWPAAVTAAVFAVHPLRAESVAWVAERKDVLSSFFGLVALLLYAGYAAAPSLRRMALVTASFVLSLLAKPMWVTLPFLLLLLDWWPLGRVTLLLEGNPKGPRWRQLWPLAQEKAVLFILTIVSCSITWSAQKSQAASTLELVPLAARFANSLASYAAYLGQAFWPAALAPFYPLPVGEISLPAVALSALLLVAISVIAASQWRARPYLAMGWLWYLGTLVPVIGLVQVGAQARADRYTYLPLIGIGIMVVWTLDELAHRLRLGAVALSAAAIVVGLLSWRCQEQIRFWHDDLALWTHAQAVTGDTWMARYCLGVARERSGKTEQAIGDYEAAIRMNANNAPLQARLGTLLHGLRRFPAARSYYEQALRINPDYAQAHANLGALLRTTRDLPGALSHLSEAVRLEPNNPENAVAYFNLGAVQEELGQRDKAIESYRQAVNLDPASASYRQSLARLRGGAPN